MDSSKAKWKFGHRQQEGASPVRPNGNFCDICKNKGLKPARFHCDECKVFYCSDCVSKHNNNPLFRYHHVAILAADKNKCKPCHVHPSQNVAFLCHTCHPKCTLCAICILDHETTHDMVNLEETAKEVRKNLKEGLGKVKAKSDQLREHIQMIKKKADHHDSVLKTVHEDIKKHALLLIEGIQQKERELLQTVKEELSNRKAGYNQGAFDLELSNMKKVTNELETVIKGTDENCISCHQRLEEQITYMMNIQTPDEITLEKRPDMKFIRENTDKDLIFGTLTHRYDRVKNNAACKNTNTRKRKLDSLEDPTLGSHLDSKCFRSVEEPGLTSTSSAVHTVGKKKKKVSAFGISKPYKADLHKTKLHENVPPESIDRIEIPPPYQEPKCEPVFDATAPHIFWDIDLSEKKQDGTSNITELCAASSSGVWKGIISHELPIEKALQEFIIFIGDRPGILCGHNIKENKCQALLHAIKSCNLEFPFDKVTAGFIDTLPLLKSKFRDFETMTIEALYQHCYGKTCKVDSIFSTVQALQRLVNRACPVRKERLLYSFQSSFIPDLQEYHMHRRRNFASWKPLIDSKVISRHIGDKAAASGLELYHVQFIYATQGLEGLTSLLSKPATEGKPRVTSSKKIIKELAEYLQFKGRQTPRF